MSGISRVASRLQWRLCGQTSDLLPPGLTTAVHYVGLLLSCTSARNSWLPTRSLRCTLGVVYSAVLADGVFHHMRAEFYGLHSAEAWRSISAHEWSSWERVGHGLVVCETRRPPGTGVATGDKLLLIAPCSQVGAKPQQISLLQSNLAIQPVIFQSRRSTPPSAKCNLAKRVERIRRKPEARNRPNASISLHLYNSHVVCAASFEFSPAVMACMDPPIWSFIGM
ncbi:hypothetical protein CHU98_g5011 [Xylaria longipes]|nr:hypothetical protein CHU98_g5011 [Xylaria longipes]